MNLKELKKGMERHKPSYGHYEVVSKISITKKEKMIQNAKLCGKCNSNKK